MEIRVDDLSSPAALELVATTFGGPFKSKDRRWQVKHATSEALDTIEPLLESVRLLPGLKEKKRGIFYRGSRAFLHFHEDGELVFADARIDGPDFDRFPCKTQRDKSRLLRSLRKALQ